MAWLTTCSCICLVLVGLVALAVQVFYFSPIDPIIVQRPLLASPFPFNNHLQKVIKLGEGILKAPEDVCVDNHDGTLYTASRDGWILRLHPNGSWEHWKNLHSHSLLGITVTAHGDVIVCDADKGLLKVTDDGITVLVSEVNGSKLRLVDEVVEASDGSLYFSDGSSKYDMHNWFLDLLEARPNGRLLKYNPSLNETIVFLDNLTFPNGVALSKDEDYLLVCETWNCLRHWLKGEKEGKTESFIENLPGGPDNIHLAPDGSFWVALVQITSKEMEIVHSSKVLKHLVASFPRLVDVIRGEHKKAVVANVGSDGKIIRIFDDSEGKVINFVTSAFEFEDHLYLGSLTSNFIGKLPLRSES